MSISKSSKSIELKFLKGSIWLSIGGALEQIFRLSRNIILARILSPTDFGIMAIILAVNGLFEALTEIGIREAIIQNPRGKEKSFLNGSFWFAASRATILYIMVFFCAPLIARFYNNSDLIPLLRVAFLYMLFIGTISPMAAIALKDMKYGYWSLFFHGGGILGISAAVLLSYFITNVWALVFGFVLEGLTRFILSYILFPFLPGFTFDRDNFRSLAKFVGGMFGIPILTFIFLKTHILVVGKLLSIKELGLYSMAVAIAWVPFRFITEIASRLLLPAFSKKQNDKEWINNWALNATKFILSFGIPLLFFTHLYGKDFLILIYGLEYGSVSTPFTISFLVALLWACSVPINGIYISQGLTAQHRIFVAIRAIITIVLIFPMINYYGLIGAASSTFIAITISYLLQLFKLTQITRLKLSEILKIFFKIVTISSITYIFWLFTKELKQTNLYVRLMPGIAVLLFTYILLIVIFLKNRSNNINEQVAASKKNKYEKKIS